MMTTPAHQKKPEKKRLGRGLSALFGEEAEKALEAALGTKEGETHSVPLEKLTINPFQPRRIFEDSMIEELAVSISKQGLLQPIIVRKSKDKEGFFQIIAGERRWRASQRAGLHDVPVVLKNVEDEDLLPLALAENIHRNDLTPMEEAEAYQKLMTMKNLTQKDVADVLGKSRPAIANALRLLNLPPSVRQLVDEKKLTSGHARLLVGFEESETLAKMIVDKQWSVRKTEDFLKKTHKLSLSPSALPVEKNPEQEELEKQLSVMLNCQVSLAHKGRQPTMTFRFSSMAAMDAMIQQMKKDLWYRKHSR